MTQTTSRIFIVPQIDNNIFKDLTWNQVSASHLCPTRTAQDLLDAVIVDCKVTDHIVPDLIFWADPLAQIIVMPWMAYLMFAPSCSKQAARRTIYAPMYAKFSPEAVKLTPK